MKKKIEKKSVERKYLGVRYISRDNKGNTRIYTHKSKV